MTELLESPSSIGDMQARVETHPWDDTPIGPISRWPQALHTLVGVMLGSRQPMFVAWGPERIMLYNDGYAPMLGQRHPAALGSRFADVWYDILPDVGPIMDRAYAGLRQSPGRRSARHEPERIPGGDLFFLLVYACPPSQRRRWGRFLHLHGNHRQASCRSSYSCQGSRTEADPR